MVQLHQVFFAMSRSSSDLQLALPDPKRIDWQSLRASGHHTKSSAIQTILHLQKAGALNTSYESGQLKRVLQDSTETHSKTMTEYGPVVQKIEIGVPGLQNWEICHPYAYLWHLTSISPNFRKIMADCSSVGEPLSLIVYADSLVPGNPFRPEKSRKLMCIYWSFVDWPDWMLSRTFAWPCFSILREAIIDEIPGKMAYLARVILRIFFPAHGESMADGVLIQSPAGPLLITAKFTGWLADLVGHKELTEWKGHSGNACCMDCDHLHKSAIGNSIPNKVGLDCWDRNKWGRRSDADFFKVIDNMITNQRTMRKTQFKRHEVDTGINYLPEGILFDLSMRSIYKPISHCLRDWQHTMVQDGVANTCIGHTLGTLAEYGYSVAQVREFMMLCTLPSKYGGKPTASWLADNRIKGNSLTSFSSLVLNIIPCIMLFLEKFCHDPELKDLVRCFKLLHVICGVLASGPSNAAKYRDRIARMMNELHELSVVLEHSLKPKLHHMHHILDNIIKGKILSCFVCERKHRSVKDAALYVFRHIEHTVLADIVNKQCEQMVHGLDLFKEQFMVAPRVVLDGLTRSRTAVLRIGNLHMGDIVWIQGARCGRVCMFYELGEHIFVAVQIYRNAFDEPALFIEEQCRETFIEPYDIVDACTWYYDAPGIIKVSIPPIVFMGM